MSEISRWRPLRDFRWSPDSPSPGRATRAVQRISEAALLSPAAASPPFEMMTHVARIRRRLLSDPFAPDLTAQFEISSGDSKPIANLSARRSMRATSARAP